MKLEDGVSTQRTGTGSDLKQYPFEKILKNATDLAQKRGLPLAAWRLPSEQARHIILDLSGKSSKVDLELESLPPGFLYSPFEHDYSHDRTKSAFLHADIYYNSNLNRLHISETVDNSSRRLAETFEQRLKDLLADDPESMSKISSSLKPRLNEKSHTDREHFINLVKLAINFINAGYFKKVVPSRRAFWPIPDGLDLGVTFEKMCTLYPHAFISLLSIPGQGVWLGASPEILVSTFMHQGVNFFRTVALAGTQQYDPAAGLSKASWRMKEIEEQAMVSRYIINCFKKIRLREFDEDGPRTVSAGNLLHLRTDFLVNMDAVNFQELGSVMLKLLHPTSAVCGLPKEPSWDFLQKRENYQRELYAGFLGPVNVGQQVNIFVNLRCMQVVREGAYLYAGAGVTADSDPEKEWIETEMKMQTLQRAFL